MAYEWVTDEMFDEKLAEIVADKPVGEILTVAYDLLREAYNDEVLESLDADFTDDMAEEYDGPEDIDYEPKSIEEEGRRAWEEKRRLG